MTIIHKSGTQCVKAVLRQTCKITGLARWLGSFLVLAALSQTVLADSVTLAWSRSMNPLVAGYNVYYGGASGDYTNVIDAGNVTNATITGLNEGTTYFIAATTYTALGVESLASSEVSYTVPILAKVLLHVTPTRQFNLTLTGPAGHTYDIMASQDLKTWSVIGTVTVGTGGSLTFTDTNAANFPKRFYRTRG